MPRKGAGTTPASPLSPLVTPRGSVSTIRYRASAQANVTRKTATDPTRAQRNPTPSPTSAATATAASRMTGAEVIPARTIRMPAAYAPAPKKAAWPKEKMPT